MPIDPENPEDIAKLKRQVGTARRQLMSFRDRRREDIEQYTGKYYGSHVREKVPVNMIEQAVSIYMRWLVGGRPGASVTTKSPALKATEVELEMTIDDVTREMRLGEKLEDFAMDALFSLGIMKVGIQTMDMDVEIDDLTRAAPTKIYTEVIDLDDWVHDTQARRFDQITFAGHRIRMRFEAVMDSKTFSQDLKDRLSPTTLNWYDSQGENRSETLSRGTEQGQGDRERFIEFWELWLPQEEIIVTFPTVGPEEAVHLVEYEGPIHGPYTTLSFNPVPNNIMPLSPLANLRDLHDLGNILFRKVSRQAERLKRMVGYRGGAVEDAERMAETNDGGAFQLEDPQGVAEIQMGGVSRETLAMFLQTRDLFNTMAGNLDALGGLEPGAETLGQDKLLTEAASRRVTGMQKATVEATGQILESIAWHIWEDPEDDRELVETIPGVPIPIIRTLRKEGSFEDFRIDVVPYTLRDQTPGEKLRVMQAIVREYTQVAPLVRQEGIVLDWEWYFRQIGRFTNFSDIEQLILFVEEQQEGSAQEPASKAPVTERTENRISRGGPSQQGSNRTLQDVLLSGSESGANRLQGVA